MLPASHAPHGDQVGDGSGMRAARHGLAGRARRRSKVGIAPGQAPPCANRSISGATSWVRPTPTDAVPRTAAVRVHLQRRPALPSSARHTRGPPALPSAPARRRTPDLRRHGAGQERDGGVGVQDQAQPGRLLTASRRKPSTFGLMSLCQWRSVLKIALPETSVEQKRIAGRGAGDIGAGPRKLRIATGRNGSATGASARRADLPRAQ